MDDEGVDEGRATGESIGCSNTAPVKSTETLEEWRALSAE